MYKGIKIGLALGGGGARGYAHIGVIKILEENGIFPDYVSGTSMGSIIGGMYAYGMTVDELYSFASKVKKLELFDLQPFSWLKDGFMNGNRLVKFLSRLSNNAKVEDTKIPFCSVCCDFKTGKEYVFKKGSLAEAMRASSAVPGVFKPFKRGDKQLLDGGMVDNLPYEVVRNMGADFVIAVDVTPKYRHYREPKNLGEIVYYSFILLMCNYEQTRSRNFNAIINVDNDDFVVFPSSYDSVNATQAIKAGEAEAQNAIQDILQKLDEFARNKESKQKVKNI